MARLAVGPRRDVSSWRWVGEDTANELAKDYEIVFFDNFETVPPADIIFVVKRRPPIAFIATAQAKGARIAYAPIDVYQHEREIDADADVLRRCELVFLHCEDLSRHVGRFTSRIALVEHHLRYVLDPMATRKDEGFVLWVGAALNLPHFIRWLEENPLPYDVRILTKLGRSDRVLAYMLAYKLGVVLHFEEGSINGFPAFQWDETRQDEMMRSCRAAIDIKGTGFSQSTKPPTKAQQFIASGIPFACNADSSVARYFARRGFDVADPHDAGRLFSESYWLETQQLAETLRRDLSLKAVGKHYRRAFEGLLEAKSSAT